MSISFPFKEEPSSIFGKVHRPVAEVGQFRRKIPIGFLSHDFIPPLLGRQEFFETFKVTFEKFNTIFE